MKTRYSLFATLLLLAVFGSACAGQPTVVPTMGMSKSTEVSPAGAPSGSVSDLDSLVAALISAGLTVETGEPVEQPFFSVPGQGLKVNGADVQVFVYDTAQAMEAEAAKVAADGGSIGTSMVNWVEPPHFFKAGRLLLLYVGEDQKIIDILTNVLGPQFAGR